MKGSFTKRGRQCDVTVTKTHLKCQLKNNLGPNVLLSLISSCPTVFGHPCTTYVEISLSDVLAIQTQARDNSEVSSVVVHYAGRKKNGRLTWEKLVLSGQPELCKELSNIFASTVPERQRSRHYLVIINPSSGKKKGSQLFHKMVAPLFRACGITFKIYRQWYRKHPKHKKIDGENLRPSLTQCSTRSSIVLVLILIDHAVTPLDLTMPEMPCRMWTFHLWTGGLSVSLYTGANLMQSRGCQGRNASHRSRLQVEGGFTEGNGGERTNEQKYRTSVMQDPLISAAVLTQIFGLEKFRKRWTFNLKSPMLVCWCLFLYQTALSTLRLQEKWYLLDYLGKKKGYCLTLPWPRN